MKCQNSNSALMPLALKRQGSLLLREAMRERPSSSCGRFSMVGAIRGGGDSFVDCVRNSGETTTCGDR